MPRSNRHAHQSTRLLALKHRYAALFVFVVAVLTLILPEIFFQMFKGIVDSSTPATSSDGSVPPTLDFTLQRLFFRSIAASLGVGGWTLWRRANPAARGTKREEDP
ncbi:MAG: hypothetical protein AAGG51_01525 [Cyanobacteria bacterium P01_G01_bin.54]